MSVLLAATSTGLLAEWLPIGGNDEVAVYVDRDTVRRTGTRVKTWLKWEWLKPQAILQTYPPKMFVLHKQLQITDCAKGTLAAAQGIYYGDLDGAQVVDTYIYSETSWSFSEAVPETIGESIVKFACKTSQPKKK